MSAEQLLNESKLVEAIAALSATLRSRPDDLHSRTFLFELLCFAGDYVRAEKQLEILEQQSMDAATGGPTFHGAIRAERKRQEMFGAKTFPQQPGTSNKVSGTFNGKPFEALEDADPRIGPHLEVFASGEYHWLPWQDITSIEMEPPTKLRHLLWAPVSLQLNDSARQQDFSQVLLPVVAALSHKHSDGAVRLGRVTDWVEDGAEEYPVGLKMLLVDGEEVPFLEIRSLEIGR